MARRKSRPVALILLPGTLGCTDRLAVLLIHRLWDHVLMQSGGWWPGAQSRPRCSYSSAWHIARDQAVRRCCLASAPAGLWQPVMCLCQVSVVPSAVDRELSVCGPCRFLSQSWSGVGKTRGIRIGAAQRSCGLRREVTLAYAALGARRWLGTRPVGPVCTTFGRSTMFLSL